MAFAVCSWLFGFLYDSITKGPRLYCVIGKSEHARLVCVLYRSLGIVNPGSWPTLCVNLQGLPTPKVHKMVPIFRIYMLNIPYTDT